MPPDLRTADAKAIQAAAARLKCGGLVAFPTETVYGLGADATHDRAVAQIFETKGRPSFNPLIVHVASPAAAAQFVVITALAERLIDAFWPGSLTLVLPRREGAGLSHLVSAGLDTAAVRMPDHPIAQALLAESGLALAAPSANLSETISPTKAAHVAESLKDADLLILDGGPCRVGLESTVVDATGEHPVILRPGGVTREALEAAVGPVLLTEETPDVPTSPGQMRRHYAPGKPLRMNAAEAQSDEAFIGFGPEHGETMLNLSPTGNLTEAAANLFAMLREADRSGYKSIAVAALPDEGLGIAINDRLKRACASAKAG